MPELDVLLGSRAAAKIPLFLSPSKELALLATIAAAVVITDVSLWIVRIEIFGRLFQG